MDTDKFIILRTHHEDVKILKNVTKHLSFGLSVFWIIHVVEYGKTTLATTATQSLGTIFKIFSFSPT